MTTILSPLRYPGAKRRLAPYMAELIDVNNLQPALFVEPFAGGASVALQLLNDGFVKKIGLVEKDPLIASFWKIVFSSDAEDLEWLVDQISTIDITLEKWHYYKSTNLVDMRERALACLFLNRTSFSGILAPSAGPLGGQAQTSAYKIDCRFPRSTLIHRIKQANALRDHVSFIWLDDWSAALQLIVKEQQDGCLPSDAFFYFDPPFFKKADRLYNHYFVDKDHTQLRDTLLQLDQPWVLSYDDCNKVDELYHFREPTHVESLYSASQNGGNRQVKEIVLTNLPQLPSNTKLWRSSIEHKK